jgi:hypothetical protein
MTRRSCCGRGGGPRRRRAVGGGKSLGALKVRVASRAPTEVAAGGGVAQQQLGANEPREIARKAGGGVSHVPQGAGAFIGLNYSMNRRISGPKPSAETEARRAPLTRARKPSPPTSGIVHRFAPTPRSVARAGSSPAPVLWRYKGGSAGPRSGRNGGAPAWWISDLGRRRNGARRPLAELPDDDLGYLGGRNSIRWIAPHRL